MSMRLDGQVAVVTGGLSGIGEAIAKRIVAEGATVIAADIDAEQKAIQEGALSSVHVDVSDPASVNALIHAVVSRYGRLDCVVNSAGIGGDIPFLETTLETFDRILSVNLRGSFIVGQAAAGAMKPAGRGAIVNIASVSGVIGNVGRSAYGASKGGVITLSRVMAVDLAGYGIRVNVIAPGPVQTPLVEQMHPVEVRSRWVNRTPMRRYASPEEIAGAAVFLCSEDASFITGAVVAVDGGFLAAGLPADSSDEWASVSKELSGKGVPQ